MAAIEGEGGENMLHIAIVDDKKEHRKMIGTFLEDYLDQAQIDHVLTIFCSGEDLLAQKERIREYEIFFVNCRMHDMDGLSVAKKIRDYTPGGLLILVSKTRSMIQDSNIGLVPCVINSRKDLVECMHLVEQKLYCPDTMRCIPFKEGTFTFSIEQILYVESHLHKVEFHILNGEYQVYTTYRTLNDIEQELNLPDTFVRIHQSFLVNIHYIQDVKNYSVFLTDGEILKASKARYKNLKDRIIKYKGQ